MIAYEFATNLTETGQITLPIEYAQRLPAGSALRVIVMVEERQSIVAHETSNGIQNGISASHTTAKVTTQSDRMFEDLDEWENALTMAETYWFTLTESARQVYSGKVVALLKDQIVDADQQLRVLKKRVRQQFANQPILYLEADAKLLPPLIVHSPKFSE